MCRPRFWEGSVSEENGDLTGFDDAELEDIMNEIESLESDFSGEDTEQPSGPQLGSDGDSALEEIEDAIAESGTCCASVPVEPIRPDLLVNSFAKAEKTELQRTIEMEIANIAPLISSQKINAASASHSKMSFSVEGEMSLKLNFIINGEKIDLHVDANEGFVIELASGARFTVPIGSSIKKAA